MNWSTLLVDKHEWISVACSHEPLTGLPINPDGKKLEYFSRQEPASKALQKLVFDQSWLKSIKCYTKFRHHRTVGFNARTLFSRLTEFATLKSDAIFISDLIRLVRFCFPREGYCAMFILGTFRCMASRITSERVFKS